jgi:hypothetical protein
MAKKEVVSVIQDSLFQLSFHKLESTNSRIYLVECVLVSSCVQVRKLPMQSCSGAKSTKSIKNKTFLVRDIVQINQRTLPPNQSLKLTEPAVSFSPRAKNF